MQELVQDFEIRNQDKLQQTLVSNKMQEKANSFAANLKKKIEETKVNTISAKTPPNSEPRSTRSRVPLDASVEKKTANKIYNKIKKGSGKTKKRKESEEIEVEEVKIAEEENKNGSSSFIKNTSLDMTS